MHLTATAATTSTTDESSFREVAAKGAYWSVILLLAINFFNYVDRQVLSAVESEIEKDLPVSQTKMGFAATAFLLSYTIIAPLFGYLADRMSRWVLVGIGVILWSIASGGTGVATTFTVLIISRCFVGVGEAAYGPAAPTILSDLYPVKSRGRILSWFYLAIPVGSAAGYVLGGQMLSHFHSWRAAFYVVLPPGLLLGAWALFFKDPRHDVAAVREHSKLRGKDYFTLFRNRSYLLDTLGMAAMTFAIGGIAFWMPKFVALRLIEQKYYSNDYHMVLGRVNLIFGAISAGLGFLATLLGGITGDLLRKKFSGSYFLVSSIAMFLGFPMLLWMLWAPFPMAWVLLAVAVFCLFFNTGPTNTALANVVHPSIRPTAFAINIFVIHIFGDAASPALIGWVADKFGPTNATHGLRFGFTIVSVFILLGGLLWLWGVKYLGEDTENAPNQLARLAT